MSRATSTSSAGTLQQGNTMNVLREKIAMRAYEKWCKRGRPQGTDKQDWTEAENELRAEMTRNGGQSQTRR
jgi:hypothetical protein